MGNSSEQNFDAVKKQQSSIRQHEDSRINAAPFFAARLRPDQLQIIAARCSEVKETLSPFEQMCIYAVKEALSVTQVDIKSDDCILVISTTKGNIEWLGQKEDERISLHSSAQVIAGYFKVKHKPVVVSNACISGSLALITGKRLLENGRYKHAVIVGCDRFSGFVFSGFQSFHALADGLCRPFDKNRTGINLGEAAACIVLSTDESFADVSPLAILSGGGLSNDANHLSGPSRTGQELANAIGQAFREADISGAQIGMVSAHGTATVFNDEMEAKALHLSGVSKAPLHSLKSYVGHTLGAAGIIESIMACMAMQEQILPVSLGYAENGVSEKVNVTTELTQADFNYLLKTASGFGGCNAALVWQK